MYEASMLKAIDELIKSIEESQDEAQAKKALDQYQRQYSTLEKPWDHVNFMYGLGLIYMHFNAYNWAIKAFREVIYVQPNFARSRDVHTRLGLIFKAIGRYKLSEKHFNLAIYDKRPNSGSGSRFELDFHLAHLYEVQGKLKQAKEAYERLLQEKDLPQQLSANINRQLGWMYFYTDLDASSATKANNRKQNMFNHQNALSNDRMDAALNYLNLSYRTDSDPKTSYYLGRCFTNIGEYHRAFDSYRSVLDREESTADTWCSIGVLYHRQNQPTDALQAYIRSVQFDKQHTVAWMNLGILYENHNQFNDALKCYQHALRSSTNGVDRSLQARIRYIQKQMAEIEMLVSNNGKSKICPTKLLSLEDLWNFESRTSLVSSSNTYNNNNNKTNNNNDSSTNLKKPEIVNTNDSKDPINQATNITTQTSNTLLKNAPAHLANDHYSNGLIIVNHDSPIKQEEPSNINCANKPGRPNESGTCTKQKSDGSSSVCPVTNQLVDNQPNGPLKNDCKLEITTQRNQDSKSKSGESKDFSLNQLLSNGASKDSGISSNSSTYTEHCALVPSHNTNITEADHKSAEHVIDACKNSPKPRKIDINLRTDDEEPPEAFLKQPPYPPLRPDKLFPSPPSIFLETKKDLASKRLQECCQSNTISIVRNIASVLKLDLGLFSTKTLVESNPDQHVDVFSHLLYQSGDDSEEPNVNLWACEQQKSVSTICRYANYQVASFKESIQEEIDNKSSGSKASLAKESETDSNESASTQAKRLNSANQTATSASQSHNNDSHTNVNANTSININSSTSNNTSSNGNNISNTNTSSQTSNSGSKNGSATKKIKKDHTPKIKYVKSAHEIDLSDEKKWRPQLSELNKLPSFIKCVSASNMLTHLGATVPGLNTIFMSMHVPGCRILGNETPNNFCTISINVGPGDYEWCAISAEYERTLSRLCNRNGFELEEKNWWPKMGDLQKYNIPIYRFSQRPGDLVWINSGTIYWVQAVGWCNKIQWNVGPLNAEQYKSATESVELNKFLFRKSPVPMIQTTWNIVININLIMDDHLFNSITNVLRRSLKYCAYVKDIVENDFSQKISYQAGVLPGPRTAKFCSLCEVEVFNIYFLKKDDEIMHCFECARRSDPSFAEYRIEQCYELKYLMKLYDNFVETKKKYKSRQKRLDGRQISQQNHNQP